MKERRSRLYSSLHTPCSPLHFAITRGQKDRKAYIFLPLQLIWSLPKGFLYFVLPQFPGPSSSELSFSIIPQLLCLINKKSIIPFSLPQTVPILKWTCLTCYQCVLSSAAKEKSLKSTQESKATHIHLPFHRGLHIFVAGRFIFPNAMIWTVMQEIWATFPFLLVFTPNPPSFFFS